MELIEEEIHKRILIASQINDYILSHYTFNNGLVKRGDLQNDVLDYLNLTKSITHRKYINEVMNMFKVRFVIIKGYNYYRGLSKTTEPEWNSEEPATTIRTV